VGPCHKGMARPQVADGGDGLQVWRKGGTIQNEYSQTADEGWSSNLIGRGREKIYGFFGMIQTMF